MKSLLLATVMIAAPLMAQDQTGTSITTRSSTSNSASKPLQDPSTPTTKDMNQPNDTSITTRSSTSPMPNNADQAGQPPMTDPATTPPPPTDAAPAPMPADQPAPPAPASGQVVFQQPQSVDQAFPPPAPKASYPACSRTVRDSCIERNGRK